MHNKQKQIKNKQKSIPKGKKGTIDKLAREQMESSEKFSQSHQVIPRKKQRQMGQSTTSFYAESNQDTNFFLFSTFLFHFLKVTSSSFPILTWSQHVPSEFLPLEPHPHIPREDALREQPIAVRDKTSKEHPRMNAAKERLYLRRFGVENALTSRSKLEVRKSLSQPRLDLNGASLAKDSPPLLLY